MFRVSSRFFWPALCLALWMFGYQTAATVCLYIAPFAIGGIPNVVVGSGARVPAEAPLQQQVAIRHSTSPYYSRSSHSGLSSDLCAVLAGVFVTFLLFAFECGPMSMEWSGPMEGEWSGVQGRRRRRRRHSLMGVGGRKLRFRHQSKSTQLSSQCALSANLPFDLSIRQRQRQLQLKLKLRGRSIQVSSILR